MGWLGTYIDVIAVTGQYFAIAALGEEGIAALEGRGPMDQVEIEIVGTEVFQGGVEGFFNVVWVLRVVPQFGGDEELAALDAGFLYGGSDGGFGAVAVVFVTVVAPLQQY